MIRSALRRCADWASFSACTAFDARLRINLVLPVTFADCGNGALGGASAAADAFIGNFVSHKTYLQIFLHVI